MGQQRCLVTKKLYHSSRIVEPGTWVWLGGSTATVLSGKGIVMTQNDLAGLDYQSVGELGNALFSPGALEKAQVRGISRSEAIALVVKNAKEFGERRVGIPSFIEGITVVDLLGWLDESSN